MKKSIFTLLLLALGAAAFYWGINQDRPEAIASQSTVKHDQPITNGSDVQMKPAVDYLFNIQKNQETGIVPVEAQLEQMNQAKAFKANQAQANKTNATVDWDDLGPNNVGGRTRVVLIDKDNDQILYAGGMSSGVFKSIDGGQNWESLPASVDMNCLAISSMIQTDDGTIYVGTGADFEAGGIYANGGFQDPGSGVFKTTDGGETFELLESTNPGSNVNRDTGTEWTAVNRLAWQKKGNTTILYASTHGAFFISSDGGETWSVPMDNVTEEPVDTGISYDVQVTTEGAVYTFIGSKFYKSTDGETFAQIDAGDDANNDGEEDTQLDDLGKFPFGIGNRKVIGVTRADPNYVYVATLKGSGFGCLDRVFQSKDGGLSFEPIAESSDEFNPTTNGQQCQGSYDFCLAVDPNNPESIYLGGVQLWKWSSNQGWQQVENTLFCNQLSYQTGVCVHPDQHWIGFHPELSNVIYVGNDGGIYTSTNADAPNPDFNPINKGYTTLQCYDIGAGHDGRVISGAQDNGTNFFGFDYNSIESAEGIYGGDGGYCAISNIDGNFVYASTQESNLQRSTNGGDGFGCILTNISNPASGNAIPQYSPAASDNCGLSGATHFIHPYELWEDHELFYKIKTWEPARVYTEADIMIDTIVHEDQTFIITTDEELYNIAVEYNTEPDEFNMYTTPVVYLQFDLDLQQIIENKFDHKFRRAKFFTMSGNKTWMTKDALVPSSPQWIDISHGKILNGGNTNTSVRPSGKITSVSVSGDGDMVVVATDKGNLARYSNLNLASEHLYLPLADDKRTIFPDGAEIEGDNHPFGDRYITAISVDPNDNNHVVVACGNYGNESYLFETFNFMADVEEIEFVSIQQDVPLGPVYSVIILRGEDTPNGDVRGNILAGNDFGVYYASRSGDDITWESLADNANGLPAVPVFKIIEEPMALYNQVEYSKSHVVYIGTHGRGVFRTTSFNDSSIPSDVTAIPDFDFTSLDDLKFEISGVKVYPNPMVGQSNIELTLNEETDITLKVFDLQGRLIKQIEDARLNVGKHNYPLSDLTPGTYVVVARTAKQKMTEKVLVAR